MKEIIKIATKNSIKKFFLGECLESYHTDILEKYPHYKYCPFCGKYIQQELLLKLK